MRKLSAIALVASAHISKLLVGFFLLKLIAHFLGSEGMGRLGHFMSALTILALLAGGGISNGIIKFVAEFRDRPRRLIKFVSAAATYSLVASLIVATALIIFSRSLAEFIFNEPSNYPFIIVLALVQALLAYTNFFFGVCNGLGGTRTYATVQLTGSIVAVPIAWYFVDRWGFHGAILALMISFALPALPALLIGLKSRFARLVSLTHYPSEDFRRLRSYTFMLLASAVAFPIVEILIRQSLIDNSGYREAGLWQAATRLSSAYSGVFSIVLAYLFMPAISSERSKSIILNKVLRTIFAVGSAFIIGASIFYQFRSFFIPTILSNDFIGLQEIILFQLVGDFFKISAYVIGFVGVAKAATGLYIGAEILQSCLFVALGSAFSRLYPGAQGIIYGYALTYLLYFLVCIFALRRYITKSS